MSYSPAYIRSNLLYNRLSKHDFLITNVLDFTSTQELLWCDNRELQWGNSCPIHATWTWCKIFSRCCCLSTSALLQYEHMGQLKLDCTLYSLYLIFKQVIIFGCNRTPRVWHVHKAVFTHHLKWLCVKCQRGCVVLHTTQAAALTPHKTHSVTVLPK